MKQFPILLQGAMEEEIKYLKTKICKAKKVVIDGFEFYEGTIENYPVVLCKTKVGSVYITLATQIAILHYQPICMINQGTAGAHNIELHKGDIVVGTSSININSYKAMPKKKGEGSNPFDWKLTKFGEERNESIEIMADEKLIQIAKNKSDKNTQAKINFGILGSGDCWNNEWDRIEWFSNRYHVLAEDMESFNAYQVAQYYQIPILGIRVISNNERLQESYDKKIAQRSQQFTIEVVKEVIEEIKKESI